jgi:LSD1 subclass zinc finger protein
MGQLLFRCPKTGKDFDSGFQAGSSEVNQLPAGAKFRVRCAVCGDLHEVRFTDAKVNDKTAPPLR